MPGLHELDVSGNARVRQRDHARTRRAVLDAAKMAVQQHGVGVSLAEIARSSGVSKGGLLHHFPAKDELLLALAEDLCEAFDDEVRHLAQAEPPGPGALARAYVRATFTEITAPGVLQRHGALINLIVAAPNVAAYVSARLARWATELAADGIAPEVVRLVMTAADGAALSAAIGDAGVVAAEQQRHLIALIDAHRKVAALLI